MSRHTLRRYFRHGLFPQLLVFEAVARLGSVTRAAEELHLAQPTVSMQLKKLSRSLELTLFEPDGRRLKITPAGEALLAVCRELIALFQRAEQTLTPFRSRGGGGGREDRESASRLLAERAAELERLAAFVRGALGFDAYNSAPEEEKAPWTSRATTTRR